MASGVGTATLSFGAAPGTNVVSTVITGQTGITALSYAEAWFMDDSTSDHNAYEHSRMFPGRVGLSCGAIVVGTGFTIFAETELRLTGDIKCRWVWST